MTPFFVTFSLLEIHLLPSLFVLIVWTGLQRRRWIWHDSWGEVSEKLHRLGLAAIAAISAAAEIGNRGGVRLLISSFSSARSPCERSLKKAMDWTWLPGDFGTNQYAFTDLMSRFPNAKVFRRNRKSRSQTDFDFLRNQRNQCMRRFQMPRD